MAKNHEISVSFFDKRDLSVMSRTAITAFQTKDAIELESFNQV